MDTLSETAAVEQPDAPPTIDSPETPVVNETATQADAPAVAPYKMFVSFVVRTSMGPTFNSTVMHGIPDILSASDVEIVSKTLMGQMGVDNCTLLFWKHLYG